MSMNIQQQIRNNANEIRSYVNDLYDWENQKETQEKTKKGIPKEIPKTTIQKTPEPNPEPQQQQQKPARVELKRDVNTVGDYYKAWSQFNVDDELNKLEKEQQNKKSTNSKPYNPYENASNNVRAKPKAAMVVKGGREVVKDPTSLKDRGNLYFKACEYQKALECYTQCLNKLQEQSKDSPNNNTLRSIVYSNRAMTYLKISDFASAYTDCCKSLEFDNKYVKSYLRRATALRKLKRYKESLADYETILQLEPDNTEAKDEAKRIRQHLENQIKQAHERLIRDGAPTSKQTYKVEIEQVEDDRQSENQPTNYLEEL